MNNKTHTTNAAEFFGAPIYAYTRAQAVADGMQVAIPEATSREAGISVPVYLTNAVFSAYVKVPPGVVGQDVEGRLWDILWMLRCAIRRSGSCGPRINFQLYVRNTNSRPRLITLSAVIGARDIDDASPAMTVMLTTED